MRTNLDITDGRLRFGYVGCVFIMGTIKFRSEVWWEGVNDWISE